MDWSKLGRVSGNLVLSDIAVSFLLNSEHLPPPCATCRFTLKTHWRPVFLDIQEMCPMPSKRITMKSHGQRFLHLSIAGQRQESLLWHRKSIFTPLRGRVRPHQAYKVSYVQVGSVDPSCCCCCCCSRSNILDQNIKTTVFSDMFMPLEEKTLVFTMFLQHQGQSSKTSLFTLFFSERVENIVFCDAFSTKGFI